jgi:3-oxoacyl-[acyl-carrier protein] reductase
MDLGIAGQVVVITGAGRGIGAEAAKAFAEEGCKVAVWDVDRRSADDVAAALRADNVEAVSVAGSVASSSDVDRVVQEVIDSFGAIHILVNNAGNNDDASLVEMTDDQWFKVLNVCLTGSFFCSRAVAKFMIKQRYGRIINVASRAHLGIPNKANYCAAKAGLLGLARSMASELGVHNITVNTVHPGIVRTERVLAQAMYPELNLQAQQRQLIKREALPSDIINGMLFYASASSGFISGDSMFVTGGRLT